MAVQRPYFTKNPIFPLTLLILIDHMGLGIIFPVFVPIFMDSSNSIVGLEVGESLRSFWYNFTLSIFPVMMFFGATLLGGLSDQIGRKKVLLICLSGASLGYFLSGLAIDIRSLSLLLFSRALTGLTAGSMPIAQAAVVDISTEENKATNLGYVILAASLGFLLGPMTGGFFTNASIVSWFCYSTPLYLASLLALMNMWMLKFFKETFTPRQKIQLNFNQCLDYLTAPFKMKPIRFLAATFLLMQLGWSFYFQFISVFLLKKYQFSSQHLGLFMSTMGMGFALGSCWILRLLTRYLKDNTVAFTALAIATLSMLGTIYEIYPNFAWIGAFLLGIAMAIAYSILIKLFSSLVSEDQQGWIMGVSEAIAAVAWAITPLASSYLENVNLSTPLTVATFLLLISTFMLKYWKPYHPFTV